MAIVIVGCGWKLTGLSVCNLNGCDTKRPLVTLVAHHGGEGGREGNKVSHFSSDKPILPAYSVVIGGRRVLVTCYHLRSHPRAEEGYT